MTKGFDAPEYDPEFAEPFDDSDEGTSCRIVCHQFTNGWWAFRTDQSLVDAPWPTNYVYAGSLLDLAPLYKEQLTEFGRKLYFQLALIDGIELVCYSEHQLEVFGPSRMGMPENVIDKIYGAITIASDSQGFELHFETRTLELGFGDRLSKLPSVGEVFPVSPLSALSLNQKA